MEYRPECLKNPHTPMSNKPFIDLADSHFRGISDDKYWAWEAGASAMGEHILSLLKEKAPSSVIIDILECKR